MKSKHSLIPRQQFSLLHWGRHLGVISAAHRQISKVAWRTEPSSVLCHIWLSHKDALGSPCTSSGIRYLSLGCCAESLTPGLCWLKRSPSWLTQRYFTSGDLFWSWTSHQFSADAWRSQELSHCRELLCCCARWQPCSWWAAGQYPFLPGQCSCSQLIWPGRKRDPALCPQANWKRERPSKSYMNPNFLCPNKVTA